MKYISKRCLAVHHRVKMSVSESFVLESAYLNVNFKLILSICLYLIVLATRWVEVNRAKMQ